MPCEQGSKCWICLRAPADKDVNTALCVPKDENEPRVGDGKQEGGKRGGGGGKSYYGSSGGGKNRAEFTDSMNWATEKSYEVTELCTKFLGWR